MQTTGYRKLGPEVSDRTVWRTHFERFYGPVARQKNEWNE
jgi:hypothetical protein